MGPLQLLFLSLLAVFLGTLVGSLTGLVPGIHTNAVAAVLAVVHGPTALWIVSARPDIAVSQAEMVIVCFLTAVAVAHIFTGFIPATYLGAPQEGTALSVLPGHRMLLQGRGHIAVKLSAQGAILSVLGCSALILCLRGVMGDPVDLYDRMRPFIPALLTMVVVLMVLSEGSKKASTQSGHGANPSLLVDEVLFDERSDHSRAPFHEVWDLWGLSGRTVTSHGRIVLDQKKVLLEDRVRIELLFACETLRRAVERNEGRRLWVTGKVCRALRPGQGSGHRRMVWAIVLFSISGAFGTALLRCPGLPNGNPVPVAMAGLPVWGWAFMPLFSGLFGLPTLLMSLTSKPAIPPQVSDVKERLCRWEKARGLLFGSTAGSFVGWFPGITSAEAALLASQAASDVRTGEDEEDGGKATEEFLVTVGAINTANLVSNFVALFVIYKARSGAAKAAQGILGEGLVPWNSIWSVPWQLGLVLISILVSGVLAYLMTVRLSKVFACNFHRVPYRKLIASVALMLVVLVFLLSGPLGLVIMAIATLLGFIPPTVGVKRVHLMGCLIMPLLVSWAVEWLGWGAMI